jgi:V/A-type H+-transporting ATPase subunit K
MALDAVVESILATSKDKVAQINSEADQDVGRILKEANERAAEIGAGVGEQGIGAAVVGVVAEEPGFLGKGLFLMLLPETLIIFGLAVSLILMFAWAPFA